MCDIAIKKLTKQNWTNNNLVSLELFRHTVNSNNYKNSKIIS